MRGERKMGKTKHSGPIKLDTSWDPSLWASLMPMGLGKIKPHHIRDTLKVAFVHDAFERAAPKYDAGNRA
jgi:hypothetical protein